MPCCLKCGREVEAGLELFCPRCLDKAGNDEVYRRRISYLLPSRSRIYMFLGVIVMLLLGAVLWRNFSPAASLLSVPGTFPTIQAGIDAASAGDTIVLVPGVYYENIDFMGKAITLRSTRPKDRDVVAATVIQGNGNAPTVRFQRGETGETVLQGLTVAGGGAIRGDGLDSLPTVDMGGVIFIDGVSAPLIRDNIIIAGTAWQGGAISVNNSSPSIINNTINGNKAHWKGGALYISDGAKPLIRENVITNNSAEDGGGIYVLQASPLIEENQIKANSALYQGGGIMLRGGAAEIRGNIIELNRAEECGGGGALFDASPLLRLNYFENNTGGWRGGGGLYIGLRSAPQLVENVFRGNEALEGNDIWVSADSSVESSGVALSGVEIFYQD